MPDLDQILAPPPGPTAAGNAQCFEARVTRLTPRGCYVVIDGYARGLRWGPCLPADAAVDVGDRVTVQMSNRGRPWLMLGGGGSTGPVIAGRYFLGANQSIGAVMWSRIVLDSREFDTLGDPGMWHDFGFVVPEDGVYDLLGQVSFFNAGAAVDSIASVWVNGVERARGSRVYSGGQNTNHVVAATVELSADDHVQLYAYSDVVTTILGTAPSISYLSVKLSPPRGPRGNTGAQGDRGERGDAGPQGPTGPRGAQGPPGASSGVELEPWRYVGAAGEPAFENGWVNYGGDFAWAAFRKSPDGKVEIRGLVAGGPNSSTVFTLPEGYRPPSHLMFAGGANAQEFARIDVYSTGAVIWHIIRGDSGYASISVPAFDTETVDEWPIGPKGDTGPRGPAGDRGLQGDPGPAGDSGPQGPLGPPGDIGPPGMEGAPGPKGDTGDQGVQGPAGTGHETTPIGGVIAWTGREIPDDYVLADGRTLLQFDYLQGFNFAVTEWFAGNPLWSVDLNSDPRTFTVPDLRNKFLLSADPLGATGGEAFHALTVAEMPRHGHDRGDGTSYYFRADSQAPGELGVPFTLTGAEQQWAYTGVIPEGGGVAHNNMPPYVALAYIVKVRGVVIDGDHLVGPPGAQGPHGPQGDRGDVGAQGPTGDQGPAGATGPPGDTGPAGPQGVPGDAGPEGQRGPIGDTGPAGPEGPEGVKGDRGDQGAIGPAGVQGVKGDTGEKGDKGDVGDQGPAGAGVDARYARRYRSAPFTIPPGNFTRLPYDTPGGGDASLFPTDEYVAPVDGYYRAIVSWAISHVAGQPDTYFLLGVSVDGGFQLVRMGYVPAQVAGNPLPFATFSIDGTVPLRAGQRIGGMGGYSNRSTDMATNVGGGEMHTYIEVVMVAPLAPGTVIEPGPTTIEELLHA